MPHFDIVKTADVKKTYRVARIMADFDLKAEHANERFVGNIEIPDKWNIGVIVGGSGTGKTTIARELFADYIVGGYKWEASSVIDDMPKAASMEDIEKMLYAVGLGSVPSWLKPYAVLSNKWKMTGLCKSNRPKTPCIEHTSTSIRTNCKTGRFQYEP